jgi:LPS-assembly protein
MVSRTVHPRIARPRNKPRLLNWSLATVASAFLCAAGLPPAFAQTPPAAQPPVAQQPQATPTPGKPKTFAETVFAGRRTNPNARLLLQADEMAYDYQKGLVSAVGNVQIYYEGGVLEARKVTYDRKAKRVHAEGDVRYRTRDGRMIHAEMLEITDDLRDGFINSLLIEGEDKTRFAAARADRLEGKTTVYRSGVYTACELCKEDPKRPPLWQVRAARIIHDEGERVIHYEDARLEFFGVPLAWMPFFSHPDPTITRKSGFLLPTIRSSNKTGVGLEIPYFWALAPDYDATLTVTPYSRQGPLVHGEWRQRLMTGAYSVRATGIFQLDKSAFDLGPGRDSTGLRDFRGSLETTGEFAINKRWLWGWDAALLSDRLYPNDYGIARFGSTEIVNRLYLVGQGDRSYFDLRGMSFIGLSEFDRPGEQPLIHPILDYSYIFGKPVAGGELGFRVNLTSLSRRDADFDPISTTALTGNFCDSRAIMLGVTTPANCLLRGAPGEYTRASADMTWRKTVINSWGQMITPFMVVRGDLAYRRIAPDPAVASFISTDPESLVRGMPAVGVETRWPFISAHSWGTQTIEPIAQLVIRPNETQIGRFPNEDAQSLIFDDTNLFSINKYSGFDRIEGGTRLNVGAQYTANINFLGTFNALAGQSFHLFGRNSFAFGDAANTGLQSGLDTDVSDYVARFSLQTNRNILLVNRYRFDKDSLAVRRFELEASAGFGLLSLSTIYARYETQPLIGFFDRREGIFQNAAIKVAANWTLSGGVRYDFAREKIDLGMLAVSYLDECFAITGQYIADYTVSGNAQTDHRFLLRVNLRTLGGTGFTSGLAGDR